MKNNKTNFIKLLKIGVLLLGVSLLLWNCENEENTISEEKTTTQKFLVKTVENVTIDALSSKLKNSFVNLRNQHKSRVEKDVYYDYNNIVKMVDTLGNTKYSIVFQLKNQPKNVLYNLIVETEKNNNTEVRYVMKYSIANLDESSEYSYNFSNFKGTIEKYSYDDILNNEKRLRARGGGLEDEEDEGPKKPCLKLVSSGFGSGGNSTESSSSGLSGSGGISSSSSGIKSGFNTFYYFSGTSITGLSTEPLIDDDNNWNSDDDNDSNSGNGAVPPSLPGDCVSVDNYMSTIKDCDDDSSPINPKCIGKMIDENGNCVDIDPCSSIKLQIQNPRYSNKANELKQKTGLKKETGYKQNKDGSQIHLTDTNGGHSLNITVNTNTVGYMHTHVDDYIKLDPITGKEELKKPIKIFSPTDLIKFLQIVRRTKYNGIPTQLVYGTVIASTGSYTLRFTGNIDDIVGIGSAASYLEDYKRYFDEINNKEKAFLHFLKDKIGIEGINLYRIRNNGDIEKKTLEKNGEVETKDCE